ncbi:MAG: transposase zinc-binding domain-containing protein [Thermoanaerobaculia bacterium]
MATTAPGPQLYRSRRPERTLLYRALAVQFERFLGAYEERFEPTHGYLRRAIEPAVYRYLDCGIFAHGAARAHCAECGHDALIAFSCKLRCPRARELRREAISYRLCRSKLRGLSPPSSAWPARMGCWRPWRSR